ncbi:MAG: chemotaxis protein CheD [Desulfobacterales bacterium]|nr:chemotaxis protein CheD [Desulfobacterales bacterium]MBF0396624.1 chemotaxis protein CheD [Desulfobacterales bacterium]
MGLIIVGVSDFKVSNNPESTIVTYSLGSCIGITIYDAYAKVGGMLHFMLPKSNLDEEKAQKNPAMFADTGIPALFRAAYKLGAKKQRMKIVIAGGAQILDEKGFFNIGKRNHIAVQEIFSKNNLTISYEDVGGNINRTLKLDIATGDTYIKTSGQGEKKI